ncbi:MAG: hypothetical protein ABIO70_28820 [Pseudomonadota bacterium]
MKISLPEWIDFKKIEGLFNRYLRKSLDSRVVNFDFSKTRGMDLYETALLRQWIVLLQHSSVPVSVTFPKRPEPLLRKLWIDGLLLKNVTEIEGIEGRTTPTIRWDVFPWVNVSKDDSLIAIAGTAIESLGVARIHGEAEAALKTIIIEIGENAVNHGACAQVGVFARIAESTSRESHGGFTERWEKGTKYLELYVGDMGPGIVSSLSPTMPALFGQTGLFKDYSVDDRVLAYAFEFASTCDIDSRRMPIRLTTVSPAL